MKKLLYILIFAIAFTLGNCHYAYSQDSIEIPRDVAEKALTALELVPRLEAENAELKKLVKELESQSRTPCSLAIADAERLIVTLALGEPTDTKAVIKARREQRKLLKILITNTVKSQCGWRETEPVWKQLLKLSPIIGQYF